MNGTRAPVLVHAHLQLHRAHARRRHLRAGDRQAVVEESDQRKSGGSKNSDRPERQDQQRDPDQRREQADEDEIERQRDDAAGAHAGEASARSAAALTALVM